MSTDKIYICDMCGKKSKFGNSAYDCKDFTDVELITGLYNSEDGTVKMCIETYKGHLCKKCYEKYKKQIEGLNNLYKFMPQEKEE